MNMQMPRHVRGVTLIELVVAIVVISIAAAAVLGVLTAVSSRSADAMVRSQAAAIASAYLEEIRSRAFSVGHLNANRQDYDVGDYADLNEAGAHDQNGNAIAGLDQYRINVQIQNDGSLPSLPAADALRIDVTVTDPTGATVTVSGYKLNLP